MLRRRVPTNVLGILTLATARGAIAADLPYNPTRIFYDNSSSYAYIFQPDTDSDGQAKLLSVDISNTLEASDLSQTTLYPSLPFLKSGSEVAILPLEDSSGNITVISGDCSSSAGPQIWTFVPGSDGSDGNGTWTQRKLSSQETEGGINYLNAGIAFSTTVNGNSSDTDLYTFGGMCPFANSTADTWITAANYTNQMVQYSASVGKSGNVSYTSNTVATRGPPVAEAGFSITPLTPSYSVDASVNTQTQDFALIGGQTNGAFINMSQVALLSLPQQSWTFIQVSGVSNSTSKDDTTVEPRSGHTAVLSEDGNSIVVFGGWVGDISTPATPQLAMLNLGDGYGGDGAWTWTIPDARNSNISGSGLYGHGALMLPGGVMMLSGGYSIPTLSTASRLLRRATSTVNSQTLFYNVSSNSWISTYDVPASADSSMSTSENQKSGALKTTSQKTGLGVGLTVAILLILALIGYFWYLRRIKRRKRENRMSDKEGLVRRMDTFGNNWGFGVSGIDGRGGAESAGGLWGEKPDETNAGYDPLPEGSYNDQPMPEARKDVERSGVLVNNPSPQRGLRKGGLSRAQYQYHAAPRYEDGRVSRSSGHIHPIEERDEEEDRLSLHRSPAERKLKALENLLNDGKPSGDPFNDPPNPLRSHPVSPEIGPPIGAGASVRQSITNATNATNTSAMTNGTDQVSSWIKEWTASYAAGLRPTSDNPASNSSGRISPSKTDDRTSSNLSEFSDRSGISDMARTSSTRSAFFFGLSGRPSITPQHSPVDANFTNVPTTGRSRSPLHTQYRPESDQSQLSNNHLRPTRPVVERSITADSHVTAGTTWSQLMAEGEALLGSTGPSVAPLSYPKRRISDKQKQQHGLTDAELLAAAGPTPPIPPRRKVGWMGSIRRALGTYDRSFSSAAPLNPRHAPPPINTSMPPMQQYYDRSNTPSPTKLRAGAHSRAGASSSMSNRPRRTASDSSEFLRHKRGRRDWERDNEAEDPRWIPYKDDPPSPDLGDWGEGMLPEIMVQRPSISQESGAVRVRSQSQAGRSGTALSRRPVDSAIETGPGRVDDNSDVEPDDWDVEQAIAKRDVQVMFTLPKARLRVVNADPDSLSQRSVSGNSAPSSKTPKLGTASVPSHANTSTPNTAPLIDDPPRSPSNTPSFDSFKTAHQNTENSTRGSAETVRKTSNYGINIVDWEREALEKRDREEEEELAEELGKAEAEIMAEQERVRRAHDRVESLRGRFGKRF
ncbi:hypothetical protein BDV97DRAFT_347837 [Delphinella strobiligena]|nr:hypothetical protein BDV97DRAFT_347837 [Delphinella strobiligena]